MEEFFKQQARERGFGDIVKILYTATILYAGWEMDNEAWIVEMSDGSKAAFTTSHGGITGWSKEDAETALTRALGSAESIRDAVKLMWPGFESMGRKEKSCDGIAK